MCTGDCAELDITTGREDVDMGIDEEIAREADRTVGDGGKLEYSVYTGREVDGSSLIPAVRVRDEISRYIYMYL